ncbi:hypothetical protein CONPUDRAFT_75728 [Coniophora puteana RWD-64-598 SS2]|uniref:Uncharacterized protein n=1 Tax=Coniophora puteana (strain RWD-64-598) TaxID=741705 RepID=A0A5M3MH85_CONPW|nr:uncharacterized protein CONPUDRAFT_75728 [Coniophora puteana RWD-64-598 SS2]EIW77981.1 hypothetical protein CONPUDRAFT_75728 [Coniophora puteana RWD-64-598 SS2]
MHLSVANSTPQSSAKRFRTRFTSSSNMADALTSAFLHLQMSGYTYAIALAVALYDYGEFILLNCQCFVWTKRSKSSGCVDCLCLGVLSITDGTPLPKKLSKQLSSAALLYGSVRLHFCDLRYGGLICAIRYGTWVIGEITLLAPLAALQLEQVLMIILLIVLFRGIPIVETTMLYFHACDFGITRLNLPKWVMSVTKLTFVLFQTIFLMLTLSCYATYLKETRQRHTWKLWTGDDLRVVLIRDNAVFFLVSSVPMIFGAILWADPGLNEVTPATSLSSECSANRACIVSCNGVERGQRDTTANL